METETLDISLGDKIILSFFSIVVLSLLAKWLWVKYLNPDSRITVSMCKLQQAACRELLKKDILADQQQNNEIAQRLIKRSADDTIFSDLSNEVHEINTAMSIVVATLFRMCEKQTGVDCDDIFKLLAGKGIL